MEKIFYSSKEVSKMLDVEKSTLYFWEKSFEGINPRRARKSGERQYTQKDITTLRTIKYLLKDRKMTIEGAKHELKKKNKEHTMRVEVITELKNIKTKLTELQNKFIEIKQ